MDFIAGIDVGGTFTDVLLCNRSTGDLRIAKVFSTPRRQAEGLLAGLRQLDTRFDELTAVVHGTTVATNAVLERKGDRCALVTTRGFRDVLELRRRDRPTTYGLTAGYTPIVPRSRSFEIDERIDAHGRVITPLADDDVRSLAKLLKSAQIDSVAVCLLNSYCNPVHERRLADALGELMGGVPISTSHEICPEVGEFERASTTATNAFVRATMSNYLSSVQNLLESDGFRHEVQVMQSNGGLIPARRAGEMAVRTLLSGPAAGTVGAAAFGTAAGLPNVISCDMGGTSFDVALIPGGKPALTDEKNIDYGVPIKVPMIDITTVAAGGGSIASLDRTGILQVGPESAGSDPGPACYGRGGTQPTVTDANIVLGRIAARQQLGTESGFVLDIDAAKTAIRKEIAQPLGLSVTAAALAIIRIANETMAAAIRSVSIDRGHDPRGFTLVGFGGAGPMHIVELAATVGARTVLIPPFPGALSAYGCLIADAKYDYVTAVNIPVDEADVRSTIEAALSTHRASGKTLLDADGFGSDAISVEHVAEMSFMKQRYSIRVPLGNDESCWDTETLTEAFYNHYSTSYTGRAPARNIKLINLRTTVTGARPLPRANRSPRRAPSIPAFREIVFDNLTTSVEVLSRDTLEPGQTLEGPLVIEQTDTTIVLPPKSSAVVTGDLSLVVEVNR
ncbi:hydantoinase/oxoprolinase family protein [Rhodococcus sp. IEGM 1307]|uniref:hydantoinase/oxoprolinase family protein n=1 Tax=Rhodococcus sp. IEGM 1307 TaxID=3047091 RepID=UPI0024B7050A|nr:hydantoinase/oxoprolinase family protein [Rhodococcus sp. IEGM 1307]MDI9979540.1 hydantoinase/oxoprolinase family protein [Rhodococcus sp. IEGM 1307]